MKKLNNFPLSREFQKDRYAPAKTNISTVERKNLNETINLPKINFDVPTIQPINNKELYF